MRLAAALLLGGCAALPPADLASIRAGDLPDRRELTEVPFFAQERYQCGPAALAMALAFAGAPRSPQQLVEQVYLPGREGTLQAEMLAATRRAGLLAYPLPPSFAALLAEVAAGHPVIVLENLRFAVWPLWHYAVAVGYDLPSRQLILRSGTERRLLVGESAFLTAWASAGNWAFVALPPATLPATAAEADYLVAAASLERVAPAAAGAAYGAALGRWPDNLAARIGLGNVAYALGHLPQAEAEFRQASRDHPESADAWNNLAQVLHEAGRDAEALAAARQAVSLAGPRRQTYRATLEAIGAALP
jgi:tetratricopeptide (TPR) repeat protein